MQRHIVRISVFVIGAAIAIAQFTDTERAIGQVNDGEHRIHQPGQPYAVAWVCSRADRTREWWAFIDETYTWGDTDATEQNPWNVSAVRIGNGTYANYTAWRTAVLARAETQGCTVVFQDHSITEDTVEN